MQDKINILNELREAGAFVLLQADNRNYYHLPENYFNNLHADILAHVCIKSLPAINPYTVPERYFDNLPEIIIEKVGTVFNSRKNPYSVPKQYFDNLPASILSKIHALEVQLELEEISPLLSSLSKTNVYSVPENYFSVTDTINRVQNKNKQTAKVVSLFSKTSNWLKYAVAACVAAILFGGGYLYFGTNKPVVNQTVALMPVDVQKEISSLSDEEIADYLKDNNNIAVYTGVQPDGSQLQNTDIQTMLQNVSDEEIQQYLQDDPESKEAGGGI